MLAQVSVVQVERDLGLAVVCLTAIRMTVATVTERPWWRRMHMFAWASM